MVRVNHEVDANRDDEQREFKPLPAGAYKARIVASQLKEYSGSRTGMLELAFEVDGDAHPEFKGRKFWETLLIYHESGNAEMTKKIARGHLTAICDAVDYVGTLEDTTEIHFKPMKVHIKHRKRDEKIYAEPYKYEAVGEDWGTVGEGGSSAGNGDFLDADDLPDF